MTTGSDKARKPLGRGLSALLPTRPQMPVAVPTAPPVPSDAGPLQVPIDSIEANPVQPRTVFRPERLEELAASIRANGIIQPLIVRRAADKYQIIAGERRWRAARLAQLKEVPVIVQDVADPRMLELALIENIQREDLNPIETARAYDRLRRDLGLSQEEIGQRTGKDRTTITNSLRLLQLPPEIQVLIEEHKLSPGHARAILGLRSEEEQIQLAEKAAAQGLSVRQVEALVQEAANEDHRPTKRRGREASQDPNVAAAADELTRSLGTRVRIVELNEQRGRIEIEYYSQEELDRLYQQLINVR